MHILHILDHSLPLHSGYVFRTQAILHQQRLLGWDTSHLTSGKQQESVESTKLEEQIGDYTFYRTAPAGRLVRKIPVLNQFAIVQELTRRLLLVAQQIRPDILHAHSPSLNGLAALRVSKQLNIPAVYEMRATWEDAAVDHGTTSTGSLRYRMSRALETYVFNRADSVTTICEGLRREIINRGVPTERVTVIPNAVDANHFRFGGEADESLAATFGLAGRTLGFVGSFYAYEGLDLLLESVRNIREKIPNLKVLLVGGGPQEAYLRSLSAKYGLHDQVIFTGRVPHEEVQTYYRLIDIFVYPRHSMRLTEMVTPLKPLEAMAQGRLVIASDVGGHRELIQHGITGQLFTAGDSNALANEVVKLFSSEDGWQERRLNARRYVEKERNWHQVVARYASVYRSATNGKR